MPKVIFVRNDGRETEVEARAGASVMRTAIENDVGGIEAECGGCLDCATCHVYVDEAFLDRLEPASEHEEAMLGAVAAPRLATSRLSCQIAVSVALDGLKVRIPPSQ
jgi:2Fe-2S ferredoxin